MELWGTATMVAVVVQIAPGNAWISLTVLFAHLALMMPSEPEQEERGQAPKIRKVALLDER